MRNDWAHVLVTVNVTIWLTRLIPVTVSWQRYGCAMYGDTNELKCSSFEIFQTILKSSFFEEFQDIQGES